MKVYNTGRVVVVTGRNRGIETRDASSHVIRLHAIARLRLVCVNIFIHDDIDNSKGPCKAYQTNTPTVFDNLTLEANKTLGYRWRQRPIQVQCQPVNYNGCRELIAPKPRERNAQCALV
jgi:hypothetical protein